MSEASSSTEREQRRERIRDIRSRKGEMLANGRIYFNPQDPGYVPTLTPRERMMFSVRVYDEEGGYFYSYKGRPTTSIRNLPDNKSEYGGSSDELSEENCGRTSMDAAVERQQNMLAEAYVKSLVEHEEARAQRLNRYLELLQTDYEHSDEDIVEEFSRLATEFYIPRNAEEEGVIMDAGGSTYGV